MAERDSLLRAVIDKPQDDAPRLVYADWLDEHGEADHAELIRLQCALACCEERPEHDRAEASRRVDELLGRPGFGWVACDGSELEWDRGFVAEYPLAFEGDRGSGRITCHGRNGLARMLPRVLSIKLSLTDWLGDTRPQRPHLNRPWPRPITNLSFILAWPSAPVVRSLAHLPWCNGVTKLCCVKSGIPVEAFADLILSPHLARLEVIYADGVCLAGTPPRAVDELDDPQVVAAWQRILCSPCARKLRVLQLGGIGLQLALAIADSPHLDNLKYLELFESGWYPASVQQRLQERFGQVWRPVRHGYQSS